MRWLTSGESHGPAISAIIEGVPSGLYVTSEDINVELHRRMLGYGRGDRMKIESDNIEILGGIRHGYTLGSPIHLLIRNEDHVNWLDSMSVAPVDRVKDDKKINRPRPGHADLPGLIKYRFDDARNVLERASARETTMRVAVGAIAKKFFKEFNIEFGSHVVRMGEIVVPEEILQGLRKKSINAEADSSLVRCLSSEYSNKMIQLIDRLAKEGDTSGGVCEVVVKNLPPGLGSYVHWDRKLDGLLSAALMSIQAVKGVEFGLGFKASELPGSAVHDQLEYRDDKIYRLSNNAGGLEGGMTNGEDLIVRLAMKPLSTLRKTLKSINLDKKENESAHFERADIAAIGACGVVAEAGTACTLMESFLDKFGRDNLAEIRENYTHFQEYLRSRLSK